jgi:hypothetical protein
MHKGDTAESNHAAVSLFACHWLHGRRTDMYIRTLRDSVVDLDGFINYCATMAMLF